MLEIIAVATMSSRAHLTTPRERVLDEKAMSECLWMTKYFGPYQITKTTEDRFLFSKGGESALLSRV